MTIQPGTNTALIGKSGAGKTTIVNLLCRLVEPQAGTIRLGQTLAADIDLQSWRSRVAIAGQDSELVTGSVEENIAYGRPDATAAEIEDAARAAGADCFIADLPQGYATSVGPSGLSLSGGQRQRIGLARALLRQPDLLILDEATNAVDALSEAEIMKLIRDHRYFQTLLIISHRKSTLSACEHGIVLDNGRVSEAGPLASLAYFKTMGEALG
jgi:subfamily B ATP-binding cassette protein MsbA